MIVARLENTYIHGLSLVLSVGMDEAGREELCMVTKRGNKREELKGKGKEGDDVNRSKDCTNKETKEEVYEP